MLISGNMVVKKKRKTRSEVCSHLAFEWQNKLLPYIDEAANTLQSNMEINHFLTCLNNRLAVLIAMKFNVKKKK